jgi:hypothetical protein
MPLEGPDHRKGNIATEINALIDNGRVARDSTNPDYDGSIEHRVAHSKKTKEHGKMPILKNVYCQLVSNQKPGGLFSILQWTADITGGVSLDPVLPSQPHRDFLHKLDKEIFLDVDIEVHSRFF